MLNCADFFRVLTQKGVQFYCGVPDSLLKSFCAYLSDALPEDKNIIAVNEGAAVALASGVYMATGQPAVVYMQNSGEGNAANPLLSLADSKVYSIPMLLLVGWRGEPGVKDEPQHIKQGEVTLALLDAMGIRYEILPSDVKLAEAAIQRAFEYMNLKKAPYALIIRKDTFEPYASTATRAENNYSLSREDAIQEIIQFTKNMQNQPAFVSTTGMTSRELFENRAKNRESLSSDFLTVGSMGHASSIALGLALNLPNRDVFCVDGDGAMLMHMGSLATIGSSGVKNFKHILINNGAHDSVGGQPTCGFKVNFREIAKACGYTNTWLATNKDELKECLKQMVTKEDLELLEIRVKKGARKDLGRPTSSPGENKIQFMEYLKG